MEFLLNHILVPIGIGAALGFPAGWRTAIYWSSRKKAA